MLCCIRALQQVREQLATEFGSERNSLLREVELTREQYQEALAQAQKGSLFVVKLIHAGLTGSLQQGSALLSDVQWQVWVVEIRIKSLDKMDREPFCTIKWVTVEHLWWDNPLCYKMCTMACVPSAVWNVEAETNDYA